MERKAFLKHTFSALGIFAVAPIIKSCNKAGSALQSDSDNDSMGQGSGTASSVAADTSCTVTPSEIEGPFPTHSPASYIRSDIRKGDGIGTTLTSVITIVNVNDNCAALENVYVDIWHCDVNGDYSEYGDTQMQSNNYTNLHWLRGRQQTDSNGQVKFISIFPGWYQGRATHIHAHIFDQSGNTLLVTQIAFDDDLCKTVNTSGSGYGYTKGMSGYTYNNADNVFSDGFTKELSAVTGSLSEGFQLSITIHVKA
ncbi:intradiol ring-cleavage dioxygenase [Arachidicoccus ginsenosidimutans]|uniref:dioxygenase family protein n=1 Tax=Arachidicoccus sp. BS20 TaxID=1850526 RepID=UPI0007F1735B|nr:intradiol ring-cleavage dioxygenase [Arachidicoccus sp. BS20]ANI90523.1 intradiol ring-cleavage dioxygenase [Arachidicoccus sp. BS20]